MWVAVRCTYKSRNWPQCATQTVGLTIYKAQSLISAAWNGTEMPSKQCASAIQYELHAMKMPTDSESSRSSLDDAKFWSQAQAQKQAAQLKEALESLRNQSTGRAAAEVASTPQIAAQETTPAAVPEASTPLDAPEASLQAEVMPPPLGEADQEMQVCIAARKKACASGIHCNLVVPTNLNRVFDT